MKYHPSENAQRNSLPIHCTACVPSPPGEKMYLPALTSVHPSSLPKSQPRWSVLSAWRVQ